MTCSRGEFKFGSFLLWIATRFRRWHGNRSRWWIVRPSVPPFVCPSLWLVVECAARIDFCRSFVANRRYSGGRQLISAWGRSGPARGRENKQQRIPPNVSAFFFPLFFDIEILAKFKPKRERERAKLVEFTLEKKNKIFDNVPNFARENKRCKFSCDWDFVDSVNVVVDKGSSVCLNVSSFLTWSFLSEMCNSCDWDFVDIICSCVVYTNESFNVSYLNLITSFWNVLLLWSTLFVDSVNNVVVVYTNESLNVSLLCLIISSWNIPTLLSEILWILWMLLFALHIWELDILEFEGSKLCGERKIGQESSIKPCSSRRIFELIAHRNLPPDYAIDGKTDV